MDGWMDGWTDRWTDGQKDRQADRYTHIDRSTYAYTYIDTRRM